MEMCTFEQYLKEPYALDFQQMQFGDIRPSLRRLILQENVLEPCSFINPERCMRSMILS